MAEAEQDPQGDGSTHQGESSRSGETPPRSEGGDPERGEVRTRDARSTPSTNGGSDRRARRRPRTEEPHEEDSTPLPPSPPETGGGAAGIPTPVPDSQGQSHVVQALNFDQESVEVLPGQVNDHALVQLQNYESQLEIIDAAAADAGAADAGAAAAQEETAEVKVLKAAFFDEESFIGSIGEERPVPPGTFVPMYVVENWSKITDKASETPFGTAKTKEYVEKVIPVQEDRRDRTERLVHEYVNPVLNKISTEEDEKPRGEQDEVLKTLCVPLDDPDELAERYPGLYSLLATGFIGRPPFKNESWYEFSDVPTSEDAGNWLQSEKGYLVGCHGAKPNFDASVKAQTEETQKKRNPPGFGCSPMSDVTDDEAGLVCAFIEVHVRDIASRSRIRGDEVLTTYLPENVVCFATEAEEDMPGRLFTGDPEKLIANMFAHTTKGGDEMTTNELRDITSLGKTSFQNLFRGKGVDVAKSARVARIVDPYLEKHQDEKNKGVSKLWFKRHAADQDEAKEMLFVEVAKHECLQERRRKPSTWEYTYQLRRPSSVRRSLSANSPLPIMVVRAVLGGNSDEFAVGSPRQTGKNENNEFLRPQGYSEEFARDVNDTLMPLLKVSRMCVPLTSTDAALRCLPSHLGGVARSDHVPDSALSEYVYVDEKGDPKKVSFEARRVILRTSETKPTIRDEHMYRTMLYEVTTRFQSDGRPMDFDEVDFVFPAFEQVTVSRQVAIIGSCALVALKIILPWVLKNAPDDVLREAKPLCCARACEKMIKWVNKYADEEEDTGKRTRDKRLRYLLTTLGSVPTTTRSLQRFEIRDEEIGMLRSAPAFVRTFHPEGTTPCSITEQSRRRRGEMMETFQAGIELVLRGGGGAKKGIGGALAHPTPIDIESNYAQEKARLPSSTAPSTQSEEVALKEVALIVIRFSTARSVETKRAGASQLASALWEMWAVRKTASARVVPIPGRYGVALMVGTKLDATKIDTFIVSFPTDGATHSKICDVLRAEDETSFADEIETMFSSEEIKAELYDKIYKPILEHPDVLRNGQDFEYMGPAKDGDGSLLHRAASKLSEWTACDRLVVCASAMDRLVAETLKLAVQWTHRREEGGTVAVKKKGSVHAICTPETSALRAAYAKRGEDLPETPTGHLLVEFPVDARGTLLPDRVHSTAPARLCSDSEIMMRCYSASTAEYALTMAARGIIEERSTRGKVYARALRELDAEMESVHPIESRNDTLASGSVAPDQEPPTEKTAGGEQTSKHNAVFLLRNSERSELKGRENAEKIAKLWESQFERVVELREQTKDKTNVEYDSVIVLFLDGVKGHEIVSLDHLPLDRIRYAEMRPGDGIEALVRKAGFLEDPLVDVEAVEEAVDANNGVSTHVFDAIDGVSTHVFVASTSRVCMPGFLDELAERRTCSLFAWDLWQVEVQAPDELGFKLLDDKLAVRLDDARVRRLVRGVAFGDFLWRIHAMNRLGFWYGRREGDEED